MPLPWTHSEHIGGHHIADVISLAYCRPCKRWLVLRGPAIEVVKCDDPGIAQVEAANLWNLAVGAGKYEPLRTISQAFAEQESDPNEPPPPWGSGDPL